MPEAEGPGPALRDKVAFLRRPDSYPDSPAEVEEIETHMSWVFLTEETVYKLKKPVRFGLVDLASLESRRRNCEAEVRWNRRLAPDVYLGTVPLGLDSEGGLVLGAGEEVVDWLVHMRRLPERKLMDEAIARGDVRPEDVKRVAETLARFYLRARPVDIDAKEHCERLVEDVRDAAQELEELSSIAPRRIDSVSSTLTGFVGRRPALFEARLREGKVVEGHGDLRPEHVCLLDQPVIIDCVEFSRRLRTVDPVDELAFLSIECERAGGPRFIEDVLFDTYRRVTGDEPPRALVEFYATYRALLRARTSIWHLRDGEAEDPAKWEGKATGYLELAENRIDEAPELTS